MSSPTLAALIAGAALWGALFGFVLARLRCARQQRELAVALEAARTRLGALTEQQAAGGADAELRLRGAFDQLAGKALRANSELFLQLARETLGRELAVGSGALREREQALAQLIEPLRAALEHTQQQVLALERERREAFATLRSQLESLNEAQAQLSRETRNLVTALRRPEVRGRWGELTLRRVVELAGMSEHCDFHEQLHVSAEQGAIRPDLVVHMPEGRDLVVDVKTPLEAYLEALDAASEEGRRSALKRHAQQLEQRVRELASKQYWAQFERSPEFVVLFLPGDQFLSAALAERPQLLESAFAQSVILATPSTLIALLKSVAYGWRQAAVAENAALIRELGEDLFRRLAQFTGHLSKLGQRLGGALDSYNAAVGSLERHVLPEARRFPGLGIGASAALPPLSAIERRRAALQGLQELTGAAPAAGEADGHEG
ncbi:MAG TPA: DNA recombination protein RmuC [Steroidobacteraceae bacterium]|nr:DNA recombination protein RmuC [Steroidobacteraceae bacterium]